MHRMHCGHNHNAHREDLAATHSHKHCHITTLPPCNLALCVISVTVTVMAPSAASAWLIYLNFQFLRWHCQYLHCPNCARWTQGGRQSRQTRRQQPFSFSFDMRLLRSERNELPVRTQLTNTIGSAMGRRLESSNSLRRWRYSEGQRRGANSGTGKATRSTQSDKAIVNV